MSKEPKKSPSENKKIFSEKENSDFSKESDEQKKNVRADEKEKNFLTDLKETVTDLWYMSETDAEIEVFRGAEASVVSLNELKKQAGISAEESSEERDFKDFFANLTEIQGWFEEEEKETASRFLRLENLLEDNLKELKVFKIGQIEIDIYAVGLDAQNILTGIKTHAVET